MSALRTVSVRLFPLLLTAAIAAAQPAFSLEATLTVPKPAAGDYSVAISGDTALIGVPGSSAVFVYTRTSAGWSLQTELKPRNYYGNPPFGYAVALDGDTAVIGVPNDASSYYDFSFGSFYVFVRSGDTWSLQADISPSVFAAQDIDYGASVAISGNTLVIGAPKGEFARVFTRVGTTWVDMGIIQPLNSTPGDRFGTSLAISGDTIIVGAPYEDGSGTGINPRDDNAADEAGAAYIFTRTNDVWTQQAYLKPSQVRASDYFGYSVAIDGNTAAIGAQADAHARGRAFVFVRYGATWSQQATFDGGEAFGYKVALSGDLLAVAKPWIQAEPTAGTSTYTRSGATWTASTWLQATEPGNLPYSPGNIAASRGSILVASTWGPSAAHIFTTAPSCSVEFASTSQSFSPAGGGGTLLLRAPADCDWTVTSDQPWLTFSPSSGKGPATITFAVQPSTEIPSRTATLKSGAATFTVTQAGGASCTYSFNPPSLTIPAAGGRVSFSIATDPGCFWNVIVQVDWLALVQQIFGGKGPTTLDLIVPFNPGLTRTGFVNVSGQALTVTQLGSASADTTLFSRTADMVHARSAFSSTLLFDGRVLIAGGGVQQAELYDPATATFTPTGSLPDGHRADAATVLPDGKVLVVGRGNSADLYDPATGLFTPTPGSRIGSGANAATLLPNGKVLITGTVGSKHEIYDPITGTFSLSGSPIVYEKWLPSGETGTDDGGAALLLANGKVLSATKPYAQLYDPVTNAFSYTSTSAGDNTPSSVYGRSTTLLPDGKVLLTGGIDIWFGTEDHLPRDRTETYDPATGLFTPRPALSQIREGHAAVLLTDDQVLITGGTRDAFRALSSTQTELYNPTTNTFSPGGNMLAERAPSATLLNDGSVLLAGGEKLITGYPRYTFTKSAELYRPATTTPPPTLLTVSGNPAVQHADYQLVTPANPAQPGEHLIVYLTGLAPGAIPPQVFLGGRMAEITYFGPVAAYPGLSQVNIRVPVGLTPASDAPLRLRHRGRISNQVILPVR